MNTLDSLCDLPTVVVDNYTHNHCFAWASRYAPSTEEPEDIANRLCAFLDACDAEDRAFWLDRGWTSLFDHVDALCARQAGEEVEL